MGCILSFDVGTTGLKTIVISQEGRILKHCNIEYGIVQEQEGFAEQDPAVWWDAAVKSMQIVLNRRNQEGAQGHRSLGTVSKPGNVGPEL